jgi:hypothetical protein
MDPANPASSWWFYAPFILLAFMLLVLVVLSIVVPQRKYSATEELVIGLLALSNLAWALVNAARFLIYIIPFSGPAISNPYSSVLAIAIGLFLYRVRGEYPLFYGITEILVAVLAIFVSIGTPTANPLNAIVGILGGIYILIRGMDNMDKGLPASWRPPWDWLFPKNRDID